MCELAPPDGVYAVAVDRVDGDDLVALATGVMNIGVRPTIVGEPRRTLEVHLFDFDRDLYGQALRVHFVSRLRGERRFDGLDALRAQISRDADEARAATSAMRPDADRGSYG